MCIRDSARPSGIKQQECIKGERFSIWWHTTWWKCEQEKSPRGLRDWASRFPIIGAQRQSPLEWSDFAFTVIHFKCQCIVRPFQTTSAAPICATTRRSGSMSQQHTLRTAAGYTSPRRQAASLLLRFFCILLALSPLAVSGSGSSTPVASGPGSSTPVASGWGSPTPVAAPPILLVESASRGKQLHGRG